MHKIGLLLTLISVVVLETDAPAIAQSTSNLSSKLESKASAQNLPTPSSPEIVNQPVLSGGETSSQNSSSLNHKSSNVNAAADFRVFPVGLNVGDRNVISGILVRGQEDGAKAINFDNWLIPYDAVIQALKFNVTTLPSGQLEVRSPGVVTRINPRKLRNDPEIGLVFSIQDLKRLFNVGAKFDINDYSIVLEVPWLNKPNQPEQQTDEPIILDGLTRIQPGRFSLAAIEQKVNLAGGETNSTTPRGDFQAVGTAFGGSWFLRTDQPELQNGSSWRIAEAQFLKQSNQRDYFVGSQPTFWSSDGTSGDYWGFTYIQRRGFVPPENTGIGYADPRLRLRAGQIGRTISGRTEPGTLVRLVEGFGERVIAEVLVDSSGIYRFENIKSNNQYVNSNYRVLLYPQGRLTAQPEIRDASYTTTPGQIPAGASALVFSGGLRHEFGSTQSLMGNFSDFRGGIAQRWGLSEDLTVGLGGVYDESPRGLAELFFRPKNIPLQVSASALMGNRLDLVADVRFDPSPYFNMTFSSDRFSSRFNVNWNILRGMSLFATSDSRYGTGGGVQLNFSGKNYYSFARLSLDTENRLRWNLLQRLGKLELTQFGNEIGTFSELTYNVSSGTFLNLGHSLLLNYETRSQNGSNNLMTLGWRYRSEQRAIDGNYLWEAQFGYGFGSQGAGAVASLSTTVLPGILLRVRYQGVSVTSDESSFNVDLVSSLGLQRGISLGDRRTDYFRTQGGMLIQPFFDGNSNGKWDAGEKFYTEEAQILVSINNTQLKSLQPDIHKDRILVRLNPGSYRLDLDPAGFPPDWQSTNDAYAVDVVAGSYTPVLLPLARAYTVSGVITDAQGKPINGARVEAISTTSGKRLFSVTNGAGVYYLERLQNDTYNLAVNGKATENSKIKLTASSQVFQELNLQQP